ncbi:MAG: di-heme enzyme [Deltaproteobacteria bacterium]|nr:MAG: di-heme enzyme [Deltaproteobacteria bacterium]
MLCWKKPLFWFIGCLTLVSGLYGCGAPQPEPYVWALPDGVSPPKVPSDNPMTQAKVELGRYLFYDKRLSPNGQSSCATCHEQQRAFTDGKALPKGSTGETLLRNSMSLSNVAYASTLAWANPTLQTLERHVLVPLLSDDPIELGIAGNDQEVYAKLRKLPLYQDLFRRAFPDAETLVTLRQVVQALASFQRTILSFQSPHDRFLRGDANALSAKARAGRKLFFSDRLKCSRCHGGPDLNQSTDAKGELLQGRAAFFNNGLYNVGNKGTYPFGGQGLYEISADRKDIGRFKVPTLRNIEVTGPYMHDGSLKTLSDVIDHYAAGGRILSDGPNAGDGRQHPNKSPLVSGFSLTPEEKQQLLAFLQSLTDKTFLQNPSLGNPHNQDAPTP